MSKLTKNVIPAVLIVASIWIFFGFISPQYSTIQDLWASESQYKTAIDNANEVRILRNTFQANLDAISAEDQARLLKLLPDSIDQVKLMRDLNTLVTNLGLKPSRLDVNSAADQSAVVPAGDATGSQLEVPGTAGKYGTASADIEFDSSYQDFINCLSVIEKDLQLADVVSVKISGGAGATQPTSTQSNKSSSVNNGHHYSLTLNTYWLK